MIKWLLLSYESLAPVIACMSIMYITVATTGCRKSQHREKPYFSSSVDENEEKMYTSLNARMHI